MSLQVCEGLLLACDQWKLYSQTEIVVKWLLSCMYVLISKETQYKRVVTIRLFYMLPKLFAEEQSGVLLVRNNAII